MTGDTPSFIISIFFYLLILWNFFPWLHFIQSCTIKSSFNSKSDIFAVFGSVTFSSVRTGPERGGGSARKKCSVYVISCHYFNIFHFIWLWKWIELFPSTGKNDIFLFLKIYFLWRTPAKSHSHYIHTYIHIYISINKVRSGISVYITKCCLYDVITNKVRWKNEWDCILFWNWSCIIYWLLICTGDCCHLNCCRLHTHTHTGREKNHVSHPPVFSSHTV